MQAIILAGGKGTRLRPLTLDIPKPVVPLVNRPLILYQLDLLRKVGFQRVTLSLSYQPDRIVEMIGGLAQGFEVDYVVEKDPLGTGGGVRFAQSGEPGSVVVFNGDVLNDLDLGAALDFHREKRAGVTIVLTEVEDPTNFGLVRAATDGRVSQFLEKPGWEEVDSLRTVNAGTYIIEPEHLELIPRGVHSSIEREFFPALVERGIPFYAFVHRGYWIDIGTVAKYLRAHADYFRRNAPMPEGYRQVRKDLWTAGSPEVAADAAVFGPVAVGEGSRVGKGAVFSRFCVVGRNCRIGEDAHLDGCVLWDGVEVGAGSRLKGCVIGEGSRLGEHTRLSGLFALGSGAVLPDYSHFTETNEAFGDER